MFKKTKLKQNRNFFHAVWLIFLFFISIFLTVYILAGIKDMLAIGQEDKTIFVNFPKNANLMTIANILEKNKIIDEKMCFLVYSYLRKFPNNILEGEYEFNKNMDYEMILKNIKKFSVEAKEVVKLTFKEGMNILEYSELLSQNKVCGKEEFLNACNSNEFCKKYPFLKCIFDNSNTYYKLEGFLFPDTYQFFKNSKCSDVIEKFLRNFENKLFKNTDNIPRNQEIWTEIDKIAKKSNDELKKILIIASLIQAEAANKDDMLKVSSVIHNRLKTVSSSGMNQYNEYGLHIIKIDATVWYPYKNRKNTPKNIVNTFASRYNTYKIIGLPAGPICNFGIDSICAALYPALTNYYYYCHSESGEAYYAVTNSGHIANLRKAKII